MAWVYLLLASVAEVSFTTALRLSGGFRNLPAVAVLVVSIGPSLVPPDTAADPARDGEPQGLIGLASARLHRFSRATSPEPRKYE